MVEGPPCESVDTSGTENSTIYDVFKIYILSGSTKISSINSRKPFFHPKTVW